MKSHTNIDVNLTIDGEGAIISKFGHLSYILDFINMVSVRQMNTFAFSDSFNLEKPCQFPVSVEEKYWVIKQSAFQSLEKSRIKLIVHL